MNFKTLLLICFTISINCKAQWIQTNGPQGGGAITFFGNDSNIFAGTGGGGVFLSTNNGMYWSAMNNGLTNVSISSAVVAGNDLFVGTAGGGVFRSSNNGGSWQPVNSGLGGTSISVTAMVFKSTYLFAATTGTSILYRSSNNGNTWTFIPTTLSYVYDFAINGSNIFAGTANGVFLSSDDGISWTQVNNGLMNTFINSLVNIGNNLFAGTNSGVFHSSNNGNSWTAVNIGLTDTVITASVVCDTNLFVGTYSGGIFRSSNNGSSWTSVNSGLNTGSAVSTLSVIGTNLFASVNPGGMYHSDNNGNSWTAVNNGIINTAVNALASYGNKIFAGDEYHGTFVSLNNGNSWALVDTNLKAVNAFAGLGPYLFAGGFYSGVIRSNNNGSSWIAVNNGFPATTNVSSLATSGTNLFAGAASSLGGIYRSNDYGNSWTTIDSGLSNVDVRSLFVKDTIIFAGTTTGIFRSTNNGSLWTPVSTSIPNAGFINSFAVIGNAIFAGTGGAGLGSGVFVSTNDGNSWIKVDNGIPNYNVYALISNGTNLFAGTYGGIYRSTNNGSSWTPINAGLSVLDVRSLAFDGTTLYAGTNGGGVFKNLSVLCSNTFNSISTSSCGSYVSPSGNHTWISSGIYSDTLINAGGCDSVISINLTILPNPVVMIIPQGPVSFCQGDSVILSASPLLTSFQWYRYNSIISGATQMNYTAKSRGKYKCIAGDAALCSDTSNIISVYVPCMPPQPNEERVVQLNQLTNTDIQIYPNPGTGIFTLDSNPGQLQIFNSMGILIYSKDVKEGETIFDISEFSDAIYFVKLTTTESIYFHKIVLSR